MTPFATRTELSTAVTRFDTEAVRGLVLTSRYRLRYVTWGRGSDRPTIVFVHGMADQARSFAMVMARLVDAGFRCVAYELANGWDDGANLGMYRHTDFVSDLVSLLDHLNLSTIDLIGSSFGTTIALRTLVRHPDRVRRCVLKGAFARRPLRRLERGTARLGRYWSCRMADLPIRETWMRRLDGPSFAGCDPAIFEYLLQCTGRTPARAAARRTLLIDKLDLRPILHRVTQPVLLIGGDQDRIVPRWCEAELEQGLPRVHRVELSPCGHYPQYTLPGPLAETIREYLAAAEPGW